MDLYLNLNSLVCKNKYICEKSKIHNENMNAWIYNIKQSLISLAMEELMYLNYNNLWKTLIDKGIKKGELLKQTGISSSTLAKMSRNEAVSLSIILKICETLDCTIEEVVTISKRSE